MAKSQSYQGKISETPSAELVAAAVELDLISWIINRRPYVRRGRVYDVDADPWIHDICEDDSREQVIQKAAQVRISETMLSQAFWKMDTQGWSVYYAFPTDSKIMKFVKTRVAPAIQASPHLHGMLGTDDVHVKTLGPSAIFFTGAQKPDQITSDSVDMVIRDEYDLIPEITRPLLESRFEDSPHKYLRDLSHPTFPEVGIAARYKVSDQRVWQVPCPSCGKFQEITWSKVRFSERVGLACDQSSPVKKGDIRILCEFCGKSLNRLAPGRWVKMNPESGIAGWKISRLMSSRASMPILVRESRKTSEFQRQKFFNMDLGETYSPKGVNVNREILDSCIDGDYHLPSGADQTFMGIDVGVKLHVWIERHEKKQIYPVFIGTVDSFDDLDRLLPRFGVITAVVDALPETRASRKWIMKHQRRALMAFFIGDKSKNIDIIKGHGKDGRPDPGDGVINIHRTMICDEVEQEFTQRRQVLPGEAPGLPELFPHIMSMVRVVGKNAKGENRVAWQETGPNHLFMAKAYATAAWMVWRMFGYGGGSREVFNADNSGSSDEGREFSTGGDW